MSEEDVWIDNLLLHEMVGRLTPKQQVVVAQEVGPQPAHLRHHPIGFCRPTDDARLMLIEQRHERDIADDTQQPIADLAGRPLPDRTFSIQRDLQFLAAEFKKAVTPAWLKTITSFQYDEIAAKDHDVP